MGCSVAIRTTGGNRSAAEDPIQEGAAAETRLKNRWRVDFNFLCGLTLPGWLRLLRYNRFKIDPAYFHRAAIVTGFSAFNSIVAAWERIRYRKRMQAIRELPQPIFVLGHFRQGTSHLHNLLARDPRFTYPDTYVVANPHTFLTTGRIGRRILGRLLPGTRPQDNMSLSFDTPQEDEYAIALFSLISPYFGMSFPWNDAIYRNQFTLRDAPPEQVAAWKEAFHNSIWLMLMQRPDMSRVKESILTWYTDIYRAFFEDLPFIPKDRFREVSFHDLERDPIDTMREVYRGLDLSDLTTAEPHLRDYLDSISGYQKSKHRPLAEHDRRIVANRWSPFFTRWGHSV